MQRDQATGCVLSNQNHIALVMLAVTDLIGVAIQGVAVLHFQLTLNRLGRVTGRGIDAVVAVSRLGLHAIITHGLTDGSYIPAPAGAFVQGQGLIDLRAAAVGADSTRAVNEAAGRENAGGGFQLQGTVDNQIGVGTGHGGIALEGTAHGDNAVVLDGGAAGDGQFQIFAGSQRSGLSGVAGSQCIVTVSVVCTAALHGGLSLSIG